MAAGEVVQSSNEVQQALFVDRHSRKSGLTASTDLQGRRHLGARVCVVGDDDQTICQWRGSDVGNILTFSDRYPEVDRIRLDDNFRSSEGIVRTARAFIEQNDERLDKAMTPAGQQAAETGDVVALAFDTPEQEAEHIAATAQSLRGAAFLDGDAERGLAWSDMAILLRSVKRNGAPIQTTTPSCSRKTKPTTSKLSGSS